jgi:hypothetical protein
MQSLGLQISLRESLKDGSPLRSVSNHFKTYQKEITEQGPFSAVKAFITATRSMKAVRSIFPFLSGKMLCDIYDRSDSAKLHRRFASVLLRQIEGDVSGFFEDFFKHVHVSEAKRTYLREIYKGCLLWSKEYLLETRTPGCVSSYATFASLLIHINHYKFVDFQHLWKK